MTTYYITLFCEDYIPSKKINWEEKDFYRPTNIREFNSELFNNSLKRKYYSLSLTILYDIPNNSSLLLISGKLVYWFFQSEMKEEFTKEEHINCLQLLYSELGLNFKKRQLKQGKMVLGRCKNGQYKYQVLNYYLSEEKIIAMCKKELSTPL